MCACLFSPMRATCHAHCIILNFNKIFSVQRLCQVVQWRVSDVSSIISVLLTRADGPRNVGLFSIEPPDAVAGPKMFYWAQSPWKPFKIIYVYIYIYTHTHTHCILSAGHFVSTDNESHRYAMLSSPLLLPPYDKISPLAPYELSKTLGLCYILNMRDQVSHPLTKAGTIVVLRM
jgi:hypothetical protein